jgi:hypothetical protein
MLRLRLLIAGERPAKARAVHAAVAEHVVPKLRDLQPIRSLTVAA